MSIATRNNPYSFDDFVQQLLSVDFYQDDPFLQRIVSHYASEELPGLNDELKRFSASVSFRWRDMADRISGPAERPYVQHFDAYNRRIDRLVRPDTTTILEKEVFGEALLSDKMTPWEGLAKRFILFQIGEACVSCPLACTEGLVALIEEFPENRHPELDRILAHCKEGIDGDFGIGAQFMTEIQGGSDIPSNLLEAEPVADHYRIWGTKFFCSAVHADYSVITAKVTGSEEVGTFIVPSWLPGNKIKERRNGYRINRIKWKMGTAELPTAEIEYEGAIAYAIGPTNRGVANAVGIVLTMSRIAVATSSASAMTRAAREAVVYSQFRDVFGKKIWEWPLATDQLRYLVHAAQRTTAGAFKVYDLFIRLDKKLQPGLASKESPETQKLRFDLRELIILQKIATAYETVDVIRKAMSILGGHGVIEDFSALPRLFRDATVNELWEGPRNTLLMQIFRDIQRVATWYPPKEFVGNLLRGADQSIIDALAATLGDFLSKPPFFALEPGAPERAAAWDRFCDTLFKAFQERALEEVGPAPVLSKEKMFIPSVWFG